MPASARTGAPATARRLRRTWPQRLVIGLNVVVVLACVGTAIGLRYGYATVGRINRVIITHDPDVVSKIAVSQGKNGEVIAGFSDAPPGALRPENFLLVGTDTRACRPSNPQYAGAFGDAGGENTDTIMVLRTDPSTREAAILSFPRDLWVKKPTGTGRDKINSFYQPGNESLLVQTIEQNFSILIDHFVSVDFCGFRDLVDAVGPIRIPFAYPTRDTHTGLDIAEASCVSFDGDAALAYARSRYYQWKDDKGEWHYDATSDYGRQARQQDFVRRVLRKAVDSGARDPGKLQQLVRIGLEYIAVDQELSAQDVYDLGRAFRDLDPATVRSFSIEGRLAERGNSSVLVYDLADPANADVVRAFSGQAGLGGALAPDPGGAADPAGDSPSTEAVPASAGGSSAAGPARTGPSATDASRGSGTDETTPSPAEGAIVPPDDPSCT